MDSTFVFAWNINISFHSAKQLWHWVKVIDKSQLWSNTEIWTLSGA